MPDINDVYIIHVEFTNRYGVPTDPQNVDGWVLPPNASTPTPVVFSNPEVGTWEAEYQIGASGKHWVIVEGSGGIFVSGQRSFKVKERAFEPV